MTYPWYSSSSCKTSSEAHEGTNHINYLKLLGASLAVKSFWTSREDLTVQPKLDNISTKV